MHQSRPNPWRRFVRRHGWRAYALPALAVVTVAALVHGTTDSAPHHDDTAAAQHKPAVQVEGADAATAGFRAGTTAAPQVVRLSSDITSCAENSYDKLVLVSISKQHLWACEGSKQVDSTPVTTGKTTDNDQTPLGSWKVQSRETDRYLEGPGYKDYVHYWVPFNGDFGLHDAPWQKMPFGSSGWKTQGSHGCVHVPETTMNWIYQWSEVDSTVVTIES